jgi:hypothetical protein
MTPTPPTSRAAAPAIPARPSNKTKSLLIAAILFLMVSITIVLLWNNNQDQPPLAKNPVQPAAPAITPPRTVNSAFPPGVDPAASTGIITKKPVTSRQVGRTIPMTDFDQREGGREMGEFIGWVNRLTWLKYASFDFADGTADLLIMRIECAPEHAGAEIIARIDDPAGPEIARIKVAGTSRGATLQKSPLKQKVTGVHDLYITFSAGGMNIWDFKITTSAKTGPRADLP